MNDAVNTCNVEITSPKPLRVAVLASWRADGLEALFAADGPTRVVAAVVTEPCSAASHFLDHHRVPRVLRDLRGFCLRRRVPLLDPDARRLFDAETASWLGTFGPDLVVACGYGYRLAEPLLRAWPNRVIGVHDADLRLRNAAGGPRYPGLRAVRDAICAGEPETRSTAYLVTPAIDAGPPLVVSGPYPVSLPAGLQGTNDGIGTYVAVHCKRMIKDSWGPLLQKTAELYGQERVAFTGDGRVLIDGRACPVVLSR